MHKGKEKEKVTSINEQRIKINSTEAGEEKSMDSDIIYGEKKIENIEIEESPPQRSMLELANPAGIGLFGLAMGCLILGVSDFKGTEGILLTLPWLIFFPMGLQLLAGIIEFIRGQIFPATAFTIFGALWGGIVTTQYWRINNPTAEQFDDPDRSHMGVALCAILFFAVVYTILSLGVNWIFVIIFVGIDWSILFLILHIFEDSSTYLVGAGLMVICGGSLYVFAAAVTNGLSKYEVVPMGNNTPWKWESIGRKSKRYWEGRRNE